MKKPILLLTFCLSISYGFAQDELYSLFHLSPLTLNPALAGIECGGQITTNYRSQWAGFLGSASFRTMGLTYAMPIKLNQKNKLGVGAKLNYDKAGTNSISTFDWKGTLSFHHDFSKKEDVSHLISGGLEMGVEQQSFKPTDIIAQDPEEFQPFNEAFFDMGAGLNYRFSNSKINWLDFGASIFHLSSQEAQLPERYVLYVKGSLLKQKRFHINPRFFYTETAGVSVYLIGSGVSYFLDEGRKQSVELGLSYKDTNEGGFTVLSVGYFNKNIGISALMERHNVLGQSVEAAVYYRFRK